jgi:hypothetical protein
MNDERTLLLEIAKDILLLKQLELFLSYHTVIACNMALGLSEEEATSNVDEALGENSEEINRRYCTDKFIKQISNEIKENTPDQLD